MVMIMSIYICHSRDIKVVHNRKMFCVDARFSVRAMYWKVLQRMKKDDGLSVLSSRNEKIGLMSLRLQTPNDFQR